MSDDTHEVYAIRYGHHERRSSENFIGGDPHDVPQPLDFRTARSWSTPASMRPWRRSASAASSIRSAPA